MALLNNGDFPTHVSLQKRVSFPLLTLVLHVLSRLLAATIPYHALEDLCFFEIFSKVTFPLINLEYSTLAQRSFDLVYPTLQKRRFLVTTI